MKQRWPKTYAYLKLFEGDPKKPIRGTLRGRSLYRSYYKPTDPFYSMYGVGPYTMAKWKVLWPEVGNSVRAGVSGPSSVEKSKPALPDHTIVAISCETGREAHFITGMLNSSPAQIAATAYIVLHPSPHIMQNISVPKFNKKEKVHQDLSDLSKQCHTAAKNEDKEIVQNLEKEIDKIAAKIWGITDKELKAIQKALEEM